MGTARTPWVAIVIAVVVAATLVLVCTWHRWLVVEHTDDLGFSPLSMRICTQRCRVESNFDVVEYARQLGALRSDGFPFVGAAVFASLWTAVGALVACVVLALRGRLGHRAAWAWLPRLGIVALVALLVACLVFVPAAPRPWFVTESPPEVVMRAGAAWNIAVVASLAGLFGSILFAAHEASVRAMLRGNMPVARVV